MLSPLATQVAKYIGQSFDKSLQFKEAWKHLGTTQPIHGDTAGNAPSLSSSHPSTLASIAGVDTPSSSHLSLSDGRRHLSHVHSTQPMHTDSDLARLPLLLCPVLPTGSGAGGKVAA